MCSFTEFVEQYRRFRWWLQHVAQSRCGRKFYTFVRASLRVAGAGFGDHPVSAIGDHATPASSESLTSASGDHWATVEAIREATDHTLIPRLGAFVTTRANGRCQVVEVETRVCNTSSLRFVMPTPLADIQSRKVWHVCHAYQSGVSLVVSLSPPGKHGRNGRRRSARCGPRRPQRTP